MTFDPPLTPGSLIQRYKRFLADVRLDGSGEIVTAHCANPGSMRGLDAPEAPVLLSRADNPRRKLAWSWELVQTPDSWVAVHTGRTNQVAREAIEAGRIPALTGFGEIRPEVARGDGSRIDFLLREPGRADCWVEVKSVTLRQGEAARFPDARTLRGARHLRTLMTAVAGGARAVMLFLVQREDCSLFEPARDIDPGYADLLHQSVQAGVEILAHPCRVGPEGVHALAGPPMETRLT